MQHLPLDSDLTQVLSAFGWGAETIQKLEPLGGASGFSGASFWRLTTSRGQWCLRRWPKEHPSRAQLEWIHGVLAHVVNCGLTTVPVCERRTDGKTIVGHRGHLWELASWMPGEADFHRDPHPTKLKAALESLADFHHVAASFPQSPPVRGRSPGIASRLEMLNRLESGEFDEIMSRVCLAEVDEVSLRARRLIDLFPIHCPEVHASLVAAARVTIPLQVCIRDIWHDHILFRDNSVSGLVDFGAMRVDSIAADVARLIGSLALNDQDRWQLGVDCYASVHPLSDCERSLIKAFDRSFVLLAGMNWMRWIFVEGRVFEQTERVVARLDEIISRLEYPRQLL